MTTQLVNLVRGGTHNKDEPPTAVNSLKECLAVWFVEEPIRLKVDPNGLFGLFLVLGRP